MHDGLLDTDSAHLLHVRNTLKYFFDAVLFQRAQPVLQSGREHLGNSGMLLNIRLNAIGSNQQLMQTDTSLVACTRADIATLRRIKRKFSVAVTELLDPRCP